MHVFAEEGLRNVFDIIAITYEKGAKSSLYRGLPDITSNRRYIGSPPCQQISSSLYRPFRYSGPRYIGPPTVYEYIHMIRLVTYQGYVLRTHVHTHALISCTVDCSIRRPHFFVFPSTVSFFRERFYESQFNVEAHAAHCLMTNTLRILTTT